jgi:recombination protein RecT
MPMVAGILKKVRNSGELASVTAQIIHKNDKFRYWVDDHGEHIEHEPELFADRGEIIGVYAIAKTKDESIFIEPMTKQQVEQVRSVSRAKSSGPWVDWWEEMAKKTAIRRLSKKLPMSTDLEQTLRADDDLYDLRATPNKAALLNAAIKKPAEEIAEIIAEPTKEEIACPKSSD